MTPLAIFSEPRQRSLRRIATSHPMIESTVNAPVKNVMSASPQLFTSGGSSIGRQDGRQGVGGRLQGFGVQLQGFGGRLQELGNPLTEAKLGKSPIFPQQEFLLRI